MNSIDRFACALVLAAPSFAQAGDTCSTAIPIPGPGNYPVDFAGTTASGFNGQLGCAFNFPTICRDLFFQFTAPTAGDYRIVWGGHDPRSRWVFHTGAGCAATCDEVGYVPSGHVLQGMQAGEQVLFQLGVEAVPLNPGVQTPGWLSVEYCAATAPDSLEDNDTCGTALSIGEGVYGGLTVQSNDKDYYTFEIPAGDTLDAAIQFQHSIADLDLYLWNPGSGCSGPPLRAGVSTNDGESVHFDNEAGPSRQVFLEVRVNTSGGGTCNAYDMVIDITTPGPTPIGTNYCFANANVTGVPGSISAFGSTSVMANDITLVASSLPMNATGYFLVSDTQGWLGNAGGASNGNVCLGGYIGRYSAPGQIRNSGSAGEYSLVLDLNQVPREGGLTSVSAGISLNFQSWHREPVGQGANFTNGIEVTLIP